MIVPEPSSISAWPMSTKYCFGRGSIAKLDSFIVGMGPVLLVRDCGVATAIDFDIALGPRIQDEIYSHECTVRLAGPDRGPVEGIASCAREVGGVNMLLAVGGRPVIDACKAASLLIQAWRDEGRKVSFRDLPEFCYRGKPAIHVGTVLVVPGSGDEISHSFSVVGPNAALRQFSTPSVAPKFRVCDPNAMEHLGRFQVMCAFSEVMSRLLEGLLAGRSSVYFSDGLILAGISFLMECRDAYDSSESRRDSVEGLARIGAFFSNYFFDAWRFE